MELRIGVLGWPFREAYCRRSERCGEQADDEDKDEDARYGGCEAHSRWSYGHTVAHAFDSHLLRCEQGERERERERERLYVYQSYGLYLAMVMPPPQV
jgi:hypothetical protein